MTTCRDGHPDDVDDNQLRVHPIDQPIGLEEELAIFRDSKGAKLVLAPSKPVKRIWNVASAISRENRRLERRTRGKSRATTPEHRDSGRSGDERSRRHRVQRGQPQSAKGSS